MASFKLNILNPSLLMSSSHCLRITSVFNKMGKGLTFNSKEVSVKQGDSNYELIYSGTNGNSFFISYREYTNTNLARDAFYQNLTYSINSEKIRFKDIEINIESVTNERVNFTVVSDGLEKWNS